jgi:hypothetical protein
MVILFGLPLILAVGTWVALVWKKRWSEENLFVMGWFLAGAVLNYIPTDFQIHMLNSWQIPMMILCAKGLHSKFAIGDKAKRWIIAAFILAVLPTNLYLWVWRFADLSRHDHPYYLHRNEVAAMDWLQENTTTDDIVLSSLTVGQYVPALSGNTAFLAHWAQTVDFYDKRDRVARFFDAATPDEERAETMQSFDVDYVFYGPAERALGAYEPITTPWLTLAFSSPQVNVFAVVSDKLPTAVGSGDTP